MFRYDEIIEVSREYSPYYDLLNEGDVAWKRFIITKQFYPLLNETLDCLEKENLSLWLQGTYGTGKSHATGFLKHLLWLPLAEVESHIEKLSDVQVKNRLREYRKKSRVFPVVMYGADKITNQIDFGLQIEVGVRKALKKYGIDLSLQTDFDAYAEAIEQDNSNYWDKLLEEEFELGELARSKKQMVSKLRSFDQDLFVAIRDALNRKLRPIAVPDIVTWLQDVRSALQEKGIADTIVIYWDEFTTMLDKGNSVIHEQIQRIAEASQKTGTFLYLISHRTILQGSGKEDRDKLLGRFNGVNYEMSSITTYHLIANSLQKKNYQAWNSERARYAKALNSVIDVIIETEDKVDADDLWGLFPIHPYTASIATYIARVMGSTERSIFNFLYDDKNGFKYFISNYPGNEDMGVLTVDYVFDFFENVFEEQDDPFMGSVMQKLSFSASILNKENPLFLPMLKVLLIMNIAHRKVNLSTDNNTIVIPDEDNLKLALAGSHLYKLIPEFLNFIEKSKILIPNHSHRYIVEASSFDLSEIENWKNKNKGRLSDIREILTAHYYETLFKPLQSNFMRKDAVECILEDANTPEHLVKNKIAQRLKQNHCLNFLLFVARDDGDLIELKKRISRIAAESPSGVCFVVLDTIFNEAHFDRFILYKAQNEIASSKHEEEAAKTAEKNLNGHLKKWLHEAVNNGIAYWYLLDSTNTMLSDKCSYKEISKAIDDRIAPLVFYRSFDTMGRYVNVNTAWDMKMARKAAEIFFTSTSLNELLEKAKGGPTKAATEILLDKNGAHLVNDKLDFVSRPQEHPLISLVNQIDTYLASDDEIELDTVFEPLFKPPYGYYKNHVFLSAMGFAFRNYKGKLYSPSTGEKMTDIAMIDLVENLFKYFNDNKHNLRNNLTIRVGSEKESRLVKVIEEIFELSECSSIVDARYKLAEWLKQHLKIPLWLLRYDESTDDEVKMAIQMIADDIMTIEGKLSSINPGQYEAIAQELVPIKHTLCKTFKAYDDEARRSLINAFALQNTDSDKALIVENGLEDLINHFRHNMQGDPVYWNEETMKSAFKDWLIDQLSPTPPESPPPPVPGPVDNEPKDTIDAYKVWEKAEEHPEKLLKLVKKMIFEDSYVRKLVHDRLKELQ